MKRPTFCTCSETISHVRQMANREGLTGAWYKSWLVYMRARLWARMSRGTDELNRAIWLATRAKRTFRRLTDVMAAQVNS